MLKIPPLASTSHSPGTAVAPAECGPRVVSADVTIAIEQ